MPVHNHRFRRALTFLTAGAGVAALVVTGCARGAKAAGGAKASPRNTATSAAQASDPMLALGYRIEWTGYPQVDRGAGVKSIDVLGDVVAVQDNRNILTCMEPGTGRNRWALDLGSPLLKFVGNARVGDSLYACSESEIQVLDINTGAVKSRQHLSSLANTHPLIMDGVAVFGCTTGEVLGHNLATGYKLWGYKLGGTITADPVKVGNSLGVVSQAGDVIILEPRTGESLGRRRSIYGGLSNSPVSDDSALYIAGTDQSVWAVSIEGKLIWRVRTPDRLTAQPAVVDGRVIVDIPSAGLTAFDTSGGQKQWQTAGLSGAVVGVRSGKLLVWQGRGKALISVDPARGDILERAELPTVTHITADQFADGNLYMVKADGSVDKYGTK